MMLLLVLLRLLVLTSLRWCHNGVDDNGDGVKAATTQTAWGPGAAASSAGSASTRSGHVCGERGPFNWAGASHWAQPAGGTVWHTTNCPAVPYMKRSNTAGWKDSIGDTCQSYESNSALCDSAHHYSNVKGVTAVHACCAAAAPTSACPPARSRSRPTAAATARATVAKARAPRRAPSTGGGVDTECGIDSITLRRPLLRRLRRRHRRKHWHVRLRPPPGVQLPAPVQARLQRRGQEGRLRKHVRGAVRGRLQVHGPRLRRRACCTAACLHSTRIARRSSRACRST